MNRFRPSLLLMLFVSSFFIHIQEGKTQDPLIPQDFERGLHRFSLTADHQFEGKTKEHFNALLKNCNMLGLAELHHSQQLSYFTAGLLELLHEQGFEHFALEMGPYSAQVLQNISQSPQKVATNLQSLNQSYGNKANKRGPLVFVDRKEDAVFVQKAAELGYQFWGLDQEYSLAMELHVDTLFQMGETNNASFTAAYEALKVLLKKNLFNAKKARFCNALHAAELEQFFSYFQGNELAQGRITAIKKSLTIYCKSEKQEPSNQLRADYMKANFDTFYEQQLSENEESKVFLKMGNVHLTHGLSPFGVHDLGEHLSQKSEETEKEFLIIRQLRMYQNGKDLSEKTGELILLKSLGDDKLWTIVDLRPVRKMLASGEFTADAKTEFEIYSYDLLLIPPDDQRSTFNY